jgi:type VI secretion system secreted protein Hcp
MDPPRVGESFMNRRRLPRWTFAALLTVLAFFILAPSPAAAANIYLKLTQSGGAPVLGEVTAARHGGEIEVLGYDWGVSNPVIRSGGGGGGVGKPVFSDLTIKKNLDLASVPIYDLCARGTHLTTATLTVELAGEVPRVLTRIELSSVVVTSVKASGNSNPGERPTEVLSLAYEKIRWTYYLQDARGRLIAVSTKEARVPGGSVAAAATSAETGAN